MNNLSRSHAALLRAFVNLRRPMAASELGIALGRDGFRDADKFLLELEELGLVGNAPGREHVFHERFLVITDAGEHALACFERAARLAGGGSDG